MPKYKDIGERLKQSRGYLSQQDFSKRIAVPLPTYQRYEAGERIPKGDVLYSIASICDVPVEWLMTGKVREKTEQEKEEDVIQYLRRFYSKEDIESFLKHRKEKPLQAAEEYAIYKVSDPEMAEIIQMLREHPQDKKLVLKLLKGKKDIKEALEGFEISKIKEQEG